MDIKILFYILYLLFIKLQYINAKDINWKDICNTFDRYDKNNIHINTNPKILYNISIECEKLINNWNNKYFKFIYIYNNNNKENIKLKLYNLKIEYLYLENNNIIDINLINNVNIDNLYLSNNKIKNFKFNNSSVKNLFLDNNNLQNYNIEYIIKIPNLKYLDIKNNSLSYIKLPKYDIIIDISNNNISCDDYYYNKNIINVCTKTYYIMPISIPIILFIIINAFIIVIYIKKKSKNKIKYIEYYIGIKDDQV
ncbi:putative surface protein, responsible for cell interaction [Betaentomopoxvirus amoorei]|uniref:AMV128 n=1 Tax=Amsacta moorei entomopoxvirus TaxID=28321 RepID=Q9EMS1_AMEPV|nr:putative surface protein, responsible for cell interaction [Amsacta moorei entomopoxvirus]AAG02834.1 AMV128 [Amsacta moorei entomopoxvirus]